MNYYLVVPQDVKLSWARALVTDEFLAEARQNGGAFVLLAVMVRAGAITAVAPPTWQQVEPRVNMEAVNGRASSWWNVVRRMMSVAGTRHNLVQMRVLVGVDGEPVLWERPVVLELREAGA